MFFVFLTIVFLRDLWESVGCRLASHFGPFDAGCTLGRRWPPCPSTSTHQNDNFTINVLRNKKTKTKRKKNTVQKRKTRKHTKNTN